MIDLAIENAALKQRIVELETNIAALTGSTAEEAFKAFILRAGITEQQSKLLYFLWHRERLSFPQLYVILWNGDEPSQDNPRIVIRVVVTKLRKKLAPLGEIKILNNWNDGYWMPKESKRVLTELIYRNTTGDIQ